jgi:hypothetical protein
MTVADVVAQTRDGRLEDFVREAVVLVARESHLQRDEWLVQRRYLSVESMALILAEPTDPEPASAGQEVPSLTAA